MRTYSVYVHADRSLEEKGLVLIAERFNWFAFLLPAIWAIWHRLWLALVIYLVISIGLEWGLASIDVAPQAIVILTLGWSLIFALGASEIRHRSLVARGYEEQTPVQAEDLETAEFKVVDQVVQQRKTELKNAAGPAPAMDQTDDYNY